MKTLAIACLTGVVLTLSACATPGRDVPSMTEMLRESTGQDGRACVRETDLRGYGVLRDNVLSIDGRRNYYLATVLPGCTDLATSARTMFMGGFGEICGRSMHRVVTRGSACTINQVFQFDNRDDAFATYHEIMEQREELRRGEEEVE